VYPPHLRDWPPLAALRAWLFEENERARALAQRTL
jgi:LysR family glycine cleavage system transcriptional activator